MKNIFILSTIKIYKGNSAGAGRLMNIAKSLAISDNRVFLCSTTLSKGMSVENIEEVSHNVFLVGREESENDGKQLRKLNRILNIIRISSYLWCVRNLLTQTEGKNLLYLYPSTQTIMDVMCLLLFKILSNYSIYYDVNELRRAALDNRLFSKKVSRKILEGIIYVFDYMRYVLVEKLTKYYDGLVVISTNLERYFKKYNDNLLRIPILSDTSVKLFSEVPRFAAGEKFLICFTGMIALKKEGFDLLFEALSMVKSNIENIELHLYGPIHKKKLLLHDIPTQYGIEENIIYHGIVEREKIIEEMQKSHLLIIPRPLNMQTKYGFSTKLSEYLVSGVPVLVTDVSDNSLYIKDGVNGFMVEPGDAKKMAEKILLIIGNYNDSVDKLVENALDTANEYFDYARYSNELDSFLE